MRIGELASHTGTTTTTLRFYETQGLLSPVNRTPAGYRDYAEDAVGRLDFIHRGQAAGLTLEEIKQILDIRDEGHAPCEHVSALLTRKLEHLDIQIAQLTALRESIAHLKEQTALIAPAACSPDQICRYL